MQGTWEAYKLGNNGHKYKKSKDKIKKEEKQAYGVELKKMIRNQLKEMLSTEKDDDSEHSKKEHFDIESFKKWN